MFRLVSQRYGEKKKKQVQTKPRITLPPLPLHILKFSESCKSSPVNCTRFPAHSVQSSVGKEGEKDKQAKPPNNLLPFQPTLQIFAFAGNPVALP